jgi:hypothetical protein
MKRSNLTMLLVVGVTGPFFTITGSLALDARAQEPPRQTLDELIAIATWFPAITGAARRVPDSGLLFECR